MLDTYIPPLDFHPEAQGIRSLCLGRFRQPHLSSHAPAVTSRPPAHTSERDDDGCSESGQGILDGDDVRSHDPPSDQSRGFEIAKSSGKHPLRNASQVAAQPPVSIRPPLQRKQNLGRPPPDEDPAYPSRSFDYVHVPPPAKPSRWATFPVCFSGPSCSAQSHLASAGAA